MTTIDAAIHSIRTTDSMISARTAIALLVADEVSLRLAAAPALEDAIGALERDSYEHGKVPGTPAGLDLAAAREHDRNALRTAITAHVAAEVARALAAAPGVEEAIGVVEGQMICSGILPRWALEPLRAAIAADRARAVAEARPTPDEARRMINELIGSMAIVGNGLDDSPGVVVAKRIAADASAALLRALGVES